MRSILITLLLISSTLSGPACTAQDKHCIPVEESRRLHEDALKLREFESLVDTLQGKVVILEERNKSDRLYFSDLLNSARQKLSLQKSITNDTERQAESYHDQTKYQEKRAKKFKLERNALGFVAIVELVIFVLILI